MKEFNSEEKMLGIGLTFGVVFGVLIDNVGLGMKFRSCYWCRCRTIF